MTLFLKDSLGGNCRTAMLATVAVEKQNIPESIATCQFAMQVGSIKNKAKINEEIDPKLLISKLKQEIKLLKEENKLLKEGTGANCQTDLSQQEQDDIYAKVREYLGDTSIENLELGSWFRLQFGVRFMRTLYIEKRSSDDKPVGEIQVVPKPESQSEIARLKNLLQQRDAEIDILTQMVGGDVPKPKKEAGPQYDYDNVADGYFEEQQEIEDGKELSFQKSRPSSASTCNSKVQSPVRKPTDV